jgi:hypothetical protein
MDQEKGAGHHIITKTAVERLFATRAKDGKILGMKEPAFAAALDGAQEHMDRWYGPTILPFWMDEAAQKEHGIADPHLSPEENVKRIKGWVEDNTVKAVLLAHQKKIGDAISDLGAAVHALEDTYSEAHMWRSASEHFGVETAEIQQIMVFDPTGLSGGGGIIGEVLRLKDASMGTHDEWFDKVPLDKRGQMVEGDDKAATNAIVRLLNSFMDAYDNTTVPATGAPEAEAFRGKSVGHMDATMNGIQDIVDKGIAPMFQLAQNAKVAASPSQPGWNQERQERKSEDQAEIDHANQIRPPEIEFDGALEFAPSPPLGGRPVKLKWREVNKGGRCPSYKANVTWSDAGGNHESSLPGLSLDQNDSQERMVSVDLAKGAATAEFKLTLEVPGAAGTPATLSATVNIAKPSIFERSNPPSQGDG